MLPLLSIVTVGLACLTLVLGLWRVGQKLREIEGANRPAPEPPPPAAGGRVSGSRPMLSALYQEPEPSPFEAVIRLPGGRWVVSAGVLALAALLLAGTSRQLAAPGLHSIPDSALVTLTLRVDSLVAGMGVLRDSLRLLSVATAEAKTQAPAPLRLARRPAPSRDLILPAAPPPPTGSSP